MKINIKMRLFILFLLFLPACVANLMAQNAGNEYVCYDDFGEPYASDISCSIYTCYDDFGAPFPSSLNCEDEKKDDACGCSHCFQQLVCGTECSNPDCPKNICTCNKCFTQYTCAAVHECANSEEDETYIPKGGGGGGGSGTTLKPNITVLVKSKWQQQAPRECCKACGDYLKRTGLVNVGSRTCVFRLTYQDNKGNGSSSFYGNPSNSLKSVVSVIDRHLSKGRGITVGLDYRNISSNKDGTDHFVVVTGRGYDSSRQQYYYTYMDPGRGNADLGCDTATNRLYIDGNLIHGLRQGKKNKLTHIRPNDGNCSGSTTY